MEIIPDGEQGMSYAVPALKVHGKTVAGLAAFKNHPSYLPHSGSVLPVLAEETRGYTQTPRGAALPGRHPPAASPDKKLLTTRLRQAGLGAP